jgi:hypothetical protein
MSGEIEKKFSEARAMTSSFLSTHSSFMHGQSEVLRSSIDAFALKMVDSHSDAAAKVGSQVGDVINSVASCARSSQSASEKSSEEFKEIENTFVARFVDELARPAQRGFSVSFDQTNASIRVWFDQQKEACDRAVGRVKDVSSSVIESVAAHTAHFERAGDIVSRLRGAWKEDIPTGQTPARRTIALPGEITRATRPKGDIIAEVRDARERQAELERALEMPESAEEEGDHIGLRSSTISLGNVSSLKSPMKCPLIQLRPDKENASLKQE